MRTSWIAWLLIVLVLASRAWLVMRTPPNVDGGDPAHYHELARNLSDGRGLSYSADFQYPWQVDAARNLRPTARRPPGYPVALSLLYAAGLGPRAMQWAQVLMAGLTAWVLHRLALHLELGRRASWLVVGLYLVYWPFADSARSIATETQHLLLLAAGLLFLLRGSRQGRWQELAGAGALLGLASLTRPATLLLPFALLPPMVLGGRRVALGALALLLGFLLTMAPWAIRNQLVFGHLEWGNSNKGWNLFVGTYPPSHGRAEIPAEERPAWMTQPAVGLGEFEVDRLYRGMAMRNLRRPVGELARLLGEKFVRFWFNTRSDSVTPVPTPKSLVVQVPLLAAGALGLGMMARRRTPFAWLPPWTVAYLLAVHLASIAMSRYNLSAMLLMMLGVAVVVDAATVRVRRSRATPDAA